VQSDSALLVLDSAIARATELDSPLVAEDLERPPSEAAVLVQDADGLNR